MPYNKNQETFHALLTEIEKVMKKDTFTFNKENNSFTHLKTRTEYTLANGCSYSDGFIRIDLLLIEEQINDTNFALLMEQVRFANLYEKFHKHGISIQFLIPVYSMVGNDDLLRMMNVELENYLCNRTVNAILLLELISVFFTDQIRDLESLMKNKQTTDATDRNIETSQQFSKEEIRVFERILKEETTYIGGPSSPHAKAYKELKNAKKLPCSSDNEFKQFKYRYRKWKKVKQNAYLIKNAFAVHQYPAKIIEYILSICSQISKDINSPESEIYKILNNG